jgi:hypothetical protein
MWTTDAHLSARSVHIESHHDTETNAQVSARIQLSFWLALGQGLIAGATINAVAGFGEELGWRGFLYRELSFLGFWKSSLWLRAGKIAVRDRSSDHARNAEWYRRYPDHDDPRRQ